MFSFPIEFDFTPPHPLIYASIRPLIYASTHLPPHVVARDQLINTLIFSSREQKNTSLYKCTNVRF